MIFPLIGARLVGIFVVQLVFVHLDHVNKIRQCFPLVYRHRTEVALYQLSKLGFRKLLANLKLERSFVTPEKIIYKKSNQDE